MITKMLRGEKDYYDLKITDKNGISFIMTVGGNCDLYWIPENHKINRRFEIDKTDEIGFAVFNQLFKAVKKNDNEYLPVLKDNVITFISEDWHPDEANVLKITQKDNEFVIDFIKNENREVRKQAYDKLYKVYKQFGDTIATNFIYNLKADSYDLKLRKYDNYLDATLEGSKIPTAVYTNLVNSVNKNVDALQDYFKVLAESKKIKDFSMHDVYCTVANKII